MNNALKFARLDFLTIKPFMTAKSLLILAFLPLFFIITTGSSAAIGITIAASLMYVSYPFALGEKNNLDAFYATLSVGRKNVVLGRYLFAFGLMLALTLITWIYSFVVLTVLRGDFNVVEALVSTAAMIVIFSIIQAVQLPIFFRLNYAKAKMLSVLPFLMIGLLTLLLTTTFGQNAMLFLNNVTANANTSQFAIIAGVIILIWLACLLASYALSVRFYQKRDF